MLVEENGKVYEIDPATKTVVAAATSKDQLEEVVEPVAELRVGDRVEAEGKLGKVILKSNSMYGEVIGVRFDDDTIGEYLEEHVSRSEVEEINHETPVHEVVSRFEAYKELPAFTRDELEAKAKEARWLNLRAKSLVTDSKLPFSEQQALDHVVIITGTDALDLREATDKLDAEDRMGELKGTSYRLELGEGAAAPTMGVKGSGGIDWLDDILDTELPETTDGDLASRAIETVAQFSRDQLGDEDFVRTASSFQREYLSGNDEQAEKFDRYFEEARKERLAETPKEPKVAKTDDNLDDFDATALFI
jgi:hypothetical protein